MSTQPCQPAILAPVPLLGRFLVLGLRPGADPRPSLGRLRELTIEPTIAVGLGQPLVASAGKAIARLRTFPALSGSGCAVPSTQGALWAFFGGDDAGVLLHRARAFVELAGDGFYIEEDVLAFQHGGGRDLSGYEDGTENPKGELAAATAIVAGEGAGMDGSSFVAAQKWVHDLGALARLSAGERDQLVGRHHETNEELSDAPASAHVKRAAQESYEPPAFMLRRSMPWGNVKEHGLYFVAYGASLDPFERVLARMLGLEDGIVDGLTRFSRAASGGYYWCPPSVDGRLDLRALG